MPYILKSTLPKYQYFTRGKKRHLYRQQLIDFKFPLFVELIDNMLNYSIIYKNNMYWWLPLKS